MGRVQDLHVLALPQQDGILLSPQGQVVSCDHVDVKDLRVRRRSYCVGPGLGPARSPKAPGTPCRHQRGAGLGEGQWASQGLRSQGPQESVEKTAILTFSEALKEALPSSG